VPDGYCEPADVREVLQEVDLSGSINMDIVEAHIEGVSAWLRKASGRHWYDSNGADTDTVPTAARSASTIRLDVPSSPHAQRGQIHRHDRGVRYPVTRDGPYARLPLPHGWVDTLDALEVRDPDGAVTDWTADAEYTEGRGEDYYVQIEAEEEYGNSYLYLRAASIGARWDFTGLVTAAYQHGLDAQDYEWQDVRKGVAAMAAAQVVDDDDVLAQIPDNARLVSVDTQTDRLINRALRYLGPYL
jgi:hypothetical protein